MFINMIRLQYMFICGNNTLGIQKRYNMKRYIKEGNLVLDGVRDFKLKHIFECGQCFRWIKNDDKSYTGVIKDRVINVSQVNDIVTFKDCSEEDYVDFIEEYFDMKRDYSIIKDKLRKMDSDLEAAVEFGEGIRILNQDPFEMIITFILSSNNRIPMIMRAVNGLSEKFGDYIENIEGKKYYMFPSANRLADAEISELRLSGVGFRDKYVGKTSTIISNNPKFIDDLVDMDYINAFKELQKLSGIGPKVADCIALFSLKKTQAFPVDTWVKKVMEYFYIKEDSSFKIIKEYADNNYGDIAGFAQQYLFYYARENKIG